MDRNLKEHGEKIREQMYQFIIEYITENGYAPTIRELIGAVGLKSPSSVYCHLTHLEMEGRIKTKPYSPRAIKLVGYEFRKVKEEEVC